MLEQIVNTLAPSGNEEKLKELIKSKITNRFAHYEEDVMGNLMVRIKGDGKKIMVCAAMDEDGLVVLNKEKDTAHFGTLGSAKAYPLTRLKFLDKKGAILWAKDHEKPFEEQTGLLFNEEIKVGDVCGYDIPFLSGCGKIFGKSIADRAGVFVMINVINSLDSENDLHFVFASQGKLSNRGLKTAAYGIQPDYALVLEGANENETVKLGKGAVLKLVSKGVVAPQILKEYFLSGAGGLQMDLDAKKESAVADIQSINKGVLCAALGLPVTTSALAAQAIHMDDMKQLESIVRDFASKF